MESPFGVDLRDQRMMESELAAGVPVDGSRESERKLRPYVPPTLTEYGRIRDLTLGGVGPQSDFPSGSRTA